MGRLDGGPRTGHGATEKGQAAPAEQDQPTGRLAEHSVCVSERIPDLPKKTETALFRWEQGRFCLRRAAKDGAFPRKCRTNAGSCGRRDMTATCDRRRIEDSPM